MLTVSNLFDQYIVIITDSNNEKEVKYAGDGQFVVCVYLEFQLPAGSVKHTVGARSDPQPNLLPQHVEPERKPGGQVMIRLEYLRFYQGTCLRR